jgi:histone-lysine N-methyltransferase SETMAR
VPRLLSSDQKEHCVAVCSALKVQAENDPNFISTIITDDESWVYRYDPEMKQQSFRWKMANSPRPKKAPQVRSNVKSMLICFFDTEGIVYKEFIPPGQIVNGNFYCDVLRWLRENVWCKHPVKWHNNSWAMQHDNLPAHTLLHVLQFLTSTKTTVIPHPPYSPDFAPCDFFLFPKMKLKLKV